MAKSAPALQGLQESVDGWEEEGKPACLARLDGMDTRVLLAWMGNQVLQVLREARDQPDPREIRVTKETLGQGVLLTTAHMQVCTVIRFSPSRVTKARLAPLVLPVLRAPPAPEAPLETQARMVHVALLESRGFQVLMVLRGHKERLGRREKMVSPGIQDHRVLKERRARQAQEKKEKEAWMDFKDLGETKEK